MNTGSLISTAFLYGSERSETAHDPPPEPGPCPAGAHRYRNVGGRALRRLLKRE
jgi:hypothetical protein